MNIFTALVLETKVNERSFHLMSPYGVTFDDVQGALGQFSEDLKSLQVKQDEAREAALAAQQPPTGQAVMDANEAPTE